MCALIQGTWNSFGKNSMKRKVLTENGIRFRKSTRLKPVRGQDTAQSMSYVYALVLLFTRHPLPATAEDKMLN